MFKSAKDLVNKFPGICPIISNQYARVHDLQQKLKILNLIREEAPAEAKNIEREIEKMKERLEVIVGKYN